MNIQGGGWFHQLFRGLKLATLRSQTCFPWGRIKDDWRNIWGGIWRSGGKLTFFYWHKEPGMTAALKHHIPVTDFRQCDRDTMMVVVIQISEKLKRFPLVQWREMNQLVLLQNFYTYFLIFQAGSSSLSCLSGWVSLIIAFYGNPGCILHIWVTSCFQTKKHFSIKSAYLAA